MEIAREFDEQERLAMMEMGTDTKEFLTFMAVQFLSYIVLIMRRRIQEM
jgi:hypothetical protein